MSEANSLPTPSPQTILFVEDEVIIRIHMADYLRHCGYRVVEASNAGEAMAVIETGIPIDLVFSDIQMPGTMDGFALAQWLQTSRPQIQVILTSGIVRLAERASELCEDGPFLRKPYREPQLLELIRTALAKTSRPVKGTSTAA